VLKFEISWGGFGEVKRFGGGAFLFVEERDMMGIAKMSQRLASKFGGSNLAQVVKP